MSFWTPTVNTLWDLLKLRAQDEEYTTTTFVTKAEVKTLINMAQDEVFDLTGCKEGAWTADLTASTAEYAVPSDMVSIEAMWIKDSSGNWHQLKQLDWGDYQAKLANADADDSDTADPPEYFTWWMDKYYIKPTPSASVTGGLKIRGRVRPDEVATSTDTLGVKPQFARAVLERVCQERWLAEGDEDRAGQCERRFYQDIERINNSLARLKRSRLMRVKDVEFDPDYEGDETGWNR